MSAPALRKLAVLLALIVVPAAGAVSGRSARVQVPDTSPFTVHGVRFLPRERVTVSVTVESTWVARVTAGPAGSFTTQFPRVQLGRCEGYVVRATGSRGSRAVLKVVPECAPDSPDDDLWPIDPPPKGK